MPRKAKNKMKEWRRESPGGHLGRINKMKKYIGVIPPTLHELGQKLMNRIDPDPILDRYKPKKKGEINETV
jgi:hypothetical protein